MGLPPSSAGLEEGPVSTGGEEKTALLAVVGTGAWPRSTRCQVGPGVMEKEVVGRARAFLAIMLRSSGLRPQVGGFCLF